MTVPGSPAIDDSAGAIAYAAQRGSAPSISATSAIQTLIDVVRRHLPPGIAADPAPVAGRLLQQIGLRLNRAWNDTIEAHTAALEPYSAEALSSGPPDLLQVLPRLTAALDRRVLRALLADTSDDAPDDRGWSKDGSGTEAWQRSGPASEEAAIDQLLDGDAQAPLARACKNVCAHYLAVSLDQLPLSSQDRQTLQERIGDSLSDTGGDPETAKVKHAAAKEPLLLRALSRGEHVAAGEILAAAALVPVRAVETAIALRTPRGMVSLAWKAGFSMRAAIMLQTQLANIEPGQVLVPTEDGRCPLGRNEMLWQIGFLARALDDVAAR